MKTTIHNKKEREKGRREERKKGREKKTQTDRLRCKPNKIGTGSLCGKLQN